VTHLGVLGAGLDGYDCEKNFDNYQHNEDTMAWCNEACITRHGWDGHMRPGFHDWQDQSSCSSPCWPVVV